MNSAYNNLSVTDDLRVFVKLTRAHYGAYFERLGLIERYLHHGEVPDPFPMVV